MASIAHTPTIADVTVTLTKTSTTVVITFADANNIFMSSKMKRSILMDAYHQLTVREAANLVTDSATADWVDFDNLAFTYSARRLTVSSMTATTNFDDNTDVTVEVPYQDALNDTTPSDT